MHTLFAQHHWEGLVSAGLQLCEGVRGGGEGGTVWMGELVPVILQAQQKLAERVKDHCSDLQRDGVLCS